MATFIARCGFQSRSRTGTRSHQIMGNRLHCATGSQEHAQGTMRIQLPKEWVPCFCSLCHASVCETLRVDLFFGRGNLSACKQQSEATEEQPHSPRDLVFSWPGRGGGTPGVLFPFWPAEGVGIIKICMCFGVALVVLWLWLLLQRLLRRWVFSQP